MYILVYVTGYVISELSLPPLYSGAVQERETLVLVTLDTVTLRGADGDSANDENNRNNISKQSIHCDSAEWYRLLRRL